MARIEVIALGAGLLLSASAAPRFPRRANMVQAPGIESPRRIAREMKALLAEDPDAVQPRAVLGMALSAQGKCAEALEHLDQVRRDGRAWTAEAAVAEADCWRRRGDLSQAEAAYAEATVLNPTSVIAWYRLGRTQVEQGRSTEALASLEVLEQLDKGDNATLLLELTIDLARHGEALLPTLAAAQAELAEGPRSARVALYQLEADAWLAAGLATGASDALFDASSLDLQHLEAGWTRVEALRRAGMLHDAQDVSQRTVLQPDEGAIAAAARACLRVDQGDLQAAAAELAPFRHGLTLELLEARWYLARAQGRVDAAAALEQTWRELVEDPRRSLTDLVFDP